MERGIQYLSENSDALHAFHLANYAMLLQQTRNKNQRPFMGEDNVSMSPIFDGEYKNHHISQNDYSKSWRAFQIAFILVALESTANGHSIDRDIVELIWFPTGGGKTEAYLGLAAFSMFLQKLRNQDHAGTHVLMRYTLRLLTAQQFQRASRLICAMEYIRQERIQELGHLPFTIGLWLGGAATPNTHQDARKLFRDLLKGKTKNEGFGIERCPWCGAQIGVLPTSHGKGKERVYKQYGIYEEDRKINIRCPDPVCFFNKSLPIFVVDESIYDNPPTFVIGTVDKFAMLAWKDKASAIFGIGHDGKRSNPPPNIIIQDELHLISGPLGTMVGLYESVIEMLCTTISGHKTIKPKIVSSTATIRNYKEQILALYARDKSCLFPPSGLDADDSFFAQADVKQPGRKYIGVHAPGLGSFQTTQVRTLTALCQAPFNFSLEDRDPWWTLLIFFNSLRELGTTVTLFQSDIRDYMKTLRSRYALTNYRHLHGDILELTGRIPGSKVTEAITELERDTVNYPQRGKNYPVDVCLATNIIEVGVDIDRLSLMVVSGQPKTTSQYIQVTGRVGRKSDRPGLVVTIYSASKPRDRSHYEKFHSYHEQLYAQVEPTSVTPFSTPAIDRGLHAIIASYVRQTGDIAVRNKPYPFPDEIINYFIQHLKQRANIVDPNERESLDNAVAFIVKKWRIHEYVRWGNAGDRIINEDQDPPLLRPIGAHVPAGLENSSWPTPLSMRNVDVECKAQISNAYTQILDE